MSRQYGAIGAALIAVTILALVCLQAWGRQRQIDALVRADPNSILADPTLRKRALGMGTTVYRSHCASCHGIDGRGDSHLGVPDFTTGPPLYGSGQVEDIEDIVRHGIRSPDSRGRHLASMPAYATAQPYKEEPLPALTPLEIDSLTQYLLAYTHHQTDGQAVAAGAALFADKAGCWDCHGRDATGDTAIGAPDLTDTHWLYGSGSHDDIYRSIATGRAGFSPAFKSALTAAELRAVSVYVASLRHSPTLIRTP